MQAEFEFVIHQKYFEGCMTRLKAFVQYKNAHSPLQCKHDSYGSTLRKTRIEIYESILKKQADVEKAHL